MSRVRCFVGIPLPAGIADPLAEACAALRKADRSWRDEKWVPAANLHVTVKFLGWVDESQLAALLDVIGEACEPHSAFELPFAGLRAVPGNRKPRMLWASFLDPTGSCTALAESVERAVLPFGIEQEERAFTPHVTLCRARRPKPLSQAGLDAAEAVLASAPGLMSVPSVSVFSSRLTPRGPIYSVIGAWCLRGD